MQAETSPNVIKLWQETVKGAEDRCHVHLHAELEAYLVSLLIRFTNQPQLGEQAMAAEFLRALQERELIRRYSLAHVGDQCLLLSGLFPGMAEHRMVKISYFIDLGRSAYANISNTTHDLYADLASQFVVLMDVLQSLNARHVLLPLEAYDLWKESGSQHALAVLRSYQSH
jgi:hypothetical protein